VLRVVRVSGTIKKAEEEVLRRARGLVRRVKAGAVGTGEDGVVRGCGRAVERARREAVLVQEEDEGESEEGE
jgi:ribonuclease P/MRP protein subunit POP5